LGSNGSGSRDADRQERTGGLGEEVIALVIHHDEGRKVLDHDQPDGFHAEFLVLDHPTDAMQSWAIRAASPRPSERMGQHQIAPRVASRFGRAILELGGNNAAIVTLSADLDLAARGIVFAAVGTAGQRCTSMRRIIVHESIGEELVDRIAQVNGRLPIGDPFAEGTLVGPLIDGESFANMSDALDKAVAQGGEILVGGARRQSSESSYYVEPAIVRMPASRRSSKTRRSSRSSTC
jgi:acyl-CoA reductase-like NAD-dependent aldehyde dehydrogenase